MSDAETFKRPAPKPRNFSQPFWDAAREGRLVIQYCKDTGRPQHYPRPVSVYTGSRNLEWRQVSGKGKVYAYTVTRVKPPPFRGAPDYTLATVELDEGTRILAPLVNCAAEDVKVGMRVTVCWDRIDEAFAFPTFEPAR